MLEDQHKIDLGRALNRYLFDAKLTSPMWNVSQATVRRVANHTGGLTTYNRKCDVTDAACRVSTVTAIARHGVVFWRPGNHFDYSNLGYGALGVAVSNASGMPFARYLQQQIFIPLGMQHCYLQTERQLEPGSAFNYDPGTQRRTPLEVSDTPCASSLRCSSHDLALFGSFVLNGASPTQHRILTEAKLKELLYSYQASAGEKYSFGWDQNVVDGHSGVFAQGGTYDSFALLQLIPDDQLAIAIVENTGTTLPFDISKKLVAQLLGPGKLSETKPVDASIRNDGVPLLGGWSGAIKTDKGDVPVHLSIISSHEVNATIAGTTKSCEKVEVSSLRLDCIAIGDLHSGEIPAGASPVELELYLHRDMLVGAATSQRPFQLPFWTNLKRDDSDKRLIR